MRNICLLFFMLLIFQASVAQSKIIWSDVVNNHIKMANVDGSDQRTIIAGNEVFYHVIDAQNSRILWTDTGTNSVHSINLDGSNRQVVISGLEAPQGICLDEANNIYIVDKDKIKKYSHDGLFLATLHDFLVNPLDIAIFQSQIYWITLDGGPLEKSNLDGSQRTTVLTGLEYPEDLEIDPIANKIYWTQNTFNSSTRGLFWANIDGSNAERFIDVYTRGFTLDPENQMIYWSEPDHGTIAVASLNAPGEVTYLIDEYLSEVGTISLDKTNGYLYFVNNYYADFLYRANMNTGEDLQLIASSPVHYPARLQVDTIHRKIYWINSKEFSMEEDETVGIMRANLDGSDPEKLIGFPEVESPFDLVLDLEQGLLYWTDSGLDQVGRATLDGHDITPLVATGMTAPGGIALDKENEKIYWTDYGMDKIQRANLDGSNVEDLITDALDKPYALAVSSAQGKIYWTDYNNGSLNKADLDGGNVESIITTTSPSFNRMNSVFLDEGAGKVYFTIDYLTGMINRANFDGTDVEEVNTGNFYKPADIALISSSLVSTHNVAIPGLSATLYPNPFTNDLTIESMDVIESVTLYDALGVMGACYPGLMKNRLKLFELAPLKKGLYWSVIKFTSGRFETHLIIKE